jgi:hypothetical protein
VPTPFTETSFRVGFGKSHFSVEWLRGAAGKVQPCAGQGFDVGHCREESGRLIVATFCDTKMQTAWSEVVAPSQRQKACEWVVRIHRFSKNCQLLASMQPLLRRQNNFFGLWGCEGGGA